MGWDVGGAHLKVARVDAAGKALVVEQFPCQLWHGMERLRQAVETAVGKLGNAAHHAITMTGELADIFASRHDGVLEISAAMQQCLPGARLSFYAGESGLIDAAQVAQHTAGIASANWLASSQSLDQVVSSTVTLSTTNVILSISNNHNGTFTLKALGTPGAQYYLVTSGSITNHMTNWTAVANITNITASPADGTWSCVVSNPAPAYYRPVAVNPAP